MVIVCYEVTREALYTYYDQTQLPKLWDPRGLFTEDVLIDRHLES